MQRRRFKQITPLDQRLEEQAKRLRKEAQGTPPGVEREKLVRRARQTETTAHIVGKLIEEMEAQKAAFHPEQQK